MTAFMSFAQQLQPQSSLRAAITAAYRRPEPQVVSQLLPHAHLPAEASKLTQYMAYRLAQNLREKKSANNRAALVQSLLQEFSLSSQEGVALMCLAEALLRIPDSATRNALIRDKIGQGHWQAHLGNSPSVFVNAAAWGLMITGKMVGTPSQASLSDSLKRMIGKSGAPLVRKAVDMAMRLMGEQFVLGQTISEALENAQSLEGQGFRYSYDMLGEAALTDEDALAYCASYEQAIHAIGKAAKGRGIYEGPGISIKLSALHPRYSRAQYERVMDELYPRLLSLTLLAKEYDIGINIDAEEADRLEISLDLLERLCLEPALQNWNGIGFVIQAYQKRCPQVIEFLIDLAKRSAHRLMIRLVKGAYWDSEIKRAQVDGQEGYPVYTRKVYTDVAYLACARQLLAAPEWIYPQFATHNAHTLSAIYHLAGGAQQYHLGQYEFQCLHGMGEALYGQVVGPAHEGKLNRPCRVYAPVGSHETLLAYLVRRLLENGANTSFVHRIADASISLDALVEDPATVVQEMAAKEGQVGLPHPGIALPRDLYANGRINSKGLDLSDEQQLASLSNVLLGSAQHPWQAEPLLQYSQASSQPLAASIAVVNPSQTGDQVGQVRHASLEEVGQAVQAAQASAAAWAAVAASERAVILERAAQLMENQCEMLMGLLVREAGKTYSNAVAEVREAVDFLRYYAAQVRELFSQDTHRPLGVVVCISPWNFPLAIFTGQVAAALAAGNSVLVKPAEQTPLIAAQAVRLLHQAGVPVGALQFLPGDGPQVGAALVADERVNAVMFTGSTQVAQLLNRTLATRLNEQGKPRVLVAETGGLNAMIVDSSALTEQVVSDVLASAFDSAGQRCSALRILCIQEDVAQQTLTMLQGAMEQLRMGNPERLSTDVGPVIDSEAKAGIEQHIQSMREKGKKVFQAALAHDEDMQDWAQGTFVQPTLIELDSVAELTHEIFGPVLHVVRFKGNELPALVEQINSLGYGLTLGVHTRIDETIAQVQAKAKVGNLYVNRNMVGAVVGVQPFGGEGLSGTGPKAGGPFYLLRLLTARPVQTLKAALDFSCVEREPVPEKNAFEVPQLAYAAVNAFIHWACQQGLSDMAKLASDYAALGLVSSQFVLPGPTGERNMYTLQARHCVLCIAQEESDALIQLAAVLAVEGVVLWQNSEQRQMLYQRLPAAVQAHIVWCEQWQDAGVEFDAVIYHGSSEKLQELVVQLAQRPGPIVALQGFASGETDILFERLLIERSISINTAAAGGNTRLMTMA